MPWSPSDAESKTKKADTPKARRQWSDVANSVLERTGDDAQAVRTANGVIAKQKRKKRGRLSARMQGAS